MTRRLCAAIVLAALSGLGGCTIIEKDIGHSFKHEAGELLASGQPLSVDEVLGSLGPPHQIVGLADGYAFLYQKFDVRERQLGIGSDASVLRWFKLSLADAGSSSQVFLARFNHSGEVVAASVATNSEELGEVGSIMFALNFLSQVDSAALDRDIWGPGQWGRFLLQSPNVLLNSQNSPDSGGATLDQRGTPVNVGQRTMDHRRH